MTQGTQRLDADLVARGLATSRTQAKTLVLEGAVVVDGATVTRPAHPVRPDQEVRVVADQAGQDAAWITAGWVGRGALKLVHALEVWGPAGLSVAGRRCLDVGASTGGFTQVLLTQGARQVLALDVGHGQLDPRVATRPEVVDLSGTTIRGVSAAQLGGPVGAVVCDVSFISLSHVLPVLPEVVDPDAEIVLLVKPQFEVGPDGLGRGGVVRSTAARARALARITDESQDLGLVVGGIERSPVRGATGNIEYLLWLRPSRPSSGMMDWGLAPHEVTARRDSLRLEEET